MDDGGTDGHDGGTCGKADAGYEQCIYLHCECLYPGGANAFYAKEWACTCASASTCEPQCMPTTCGNGDPDAEVPLCGDCLVSQAAINTTPCYYETVCGANQACIDFANCATHCQ